MSTASGVWSIWTNSWTIQDHYRDVAVGDHIGFAVELVEALLIPTSPGTRTGAIRLEDDGYDLRGEIAFKADDFWGIDIGFLAGYVGSVPRNAQVGAVVSGTATLTTADFLLVVGSTMGLPPLVYTWEVRGIRLESAPYVQVSEKEWEHDGSNLVPVERTTAEGAGMDTIEWVLDCALMPEPPKRMVREE